MINSYSSVYVSGHKAVKDIFSSPIIIQEKIDGSQFSFMSGADGLVIRSKAATIYPYDPPPMFRLAVEYVQAICKNLVFGWIYRGEVLCKPKHNTIKYDRVPNHNIILFDIADGAEQYLTPHDLSQQAATLGLESVPLFFSGMLTDVSFVRPLLNNISILGGSKVEGVVVKNYSMFGTDKKVLMSKYVSEEFQEAHTSSWKLRNPSKGDIIDRIVTSLRTPARWNKSIIHLREAGLLDNSPKDIGPLIAEIKKDLQKEEIDYIKDVLYNHYIGEIERGVYRTFPEWYKQSLADAKGECDNASD